jgi:hypothetical protein
MKIYKDVFCKELVETFDFGIVQAGDKKVYEFYILNDSNAELKDLKFSIEHPEIKILEAPKEMKSNDKSKLIIEWQPSITLKEGLGAKIKISASSIYKGMA